MTIIEMILLAIALSIDSLAVSMSGSVSMGKLDSCKVSSVALALAIVQTVFFLAGYFAGDAVGQFVERVGGYIGFSLLLFVGGDMIIGAIRNESEKSQDFSSFWKILIAAVATSIDAIAVGASFGLGKAVTLNDILLTAAITFIATVLFALAGMLFGHWIGRHFGRPAGIVAGIVLIAIGIRLIAV